MSYCPARYQANYPCSKRNKCRLANKNAAYDEDSIRLIHEPPVRDNQKVKVSKTDNEYEAYNAGQFPPPEPPMGEYGAWDLQFCKWWGWTWVKKSDKDGTPQTSKQADEAQKYRQIEETQNYRQSFNANKPMEVTETPAPKKKKCGFFNCFKKKKDEPPKHEEPPKHVAHFQDTRVATAPVQTSYQQTSNRRMDATTSDESFRNHESYSDECCCCGNMQSDGYFCPCNQICCPCMFQNQTCCCQVSEPQKTQKRRDSKTIETQTQREVKEQATKMSEMHVPKHRPHHGKHRTRRCPCMRKVCCPCMRNVCCPCVQNTCPCCPCNNNSNNANNINNTNKTNNEQNITNNEQSTGSHDQLVNFCLTKMKNPNLNDLFQLKTTNFSTLHKSLDLLLKNNINIMSLFSDKKFVKEEKKSNFLDTSATISFLSINDRPKETDTEHCKLLTAVCDAILSSHKFDDEKYSPLVNTLKGTASNSTQKSCDYKDSQNSFNTSKGFLGRILNASRLTRITKSNDEISLQREIGIQVDDAPTRKFEFLNQTNRKPFVRLINNKNKVLIASRCPKLKRSNEARGFKRGPPIIHNFNENTRSDENKKSKIANDFKIRPIIFKSPDDETPAKNWQFGRKFDFTSAPKDAAPKFENFEKLLSSIDFHINNDFASTHCDGILGQQEDNQSRYDVNLLDATSPPFTDYDLTFNTDEVRGGINTKGKKES